jgi:actin-like ATPase involved in cell morphogenesis
MGYQAGVDLGTTYTAAAVHRDGQVEIAWLGERAAVIPSVVFVKGDGTVVTGEAANRQGLVDPDRVAREFKRRIGDRVTVIVGGMPFPAEMLTARLLRTVVERITEREGGPPDTLALTYPANWGPYKLDLLQQAVRHAGFGDDPVTYLTEPEAAAIHYATRERVDPGSVVAVYDLGGGTFDAAALRRTTDGGYEVLGQPEGIERLGGIDFDAAVLAHVDRAVGGAVSSVDPEDPEASAAAARLWEECVAAKEVLSSDVDATIPVALPGVRQSIRLTRAEFETMIRPAIAETITGLRRALRSADVTPDDIAAVLLVGGSSRVPLVAQMVSADLGRPIAVDAHPKHGIALGAAVAAAARVEAARAESVTVVETEETAAAPLVAAVPPAAPPAAPPPAPPPPEAPPAPEPAATSGPGPLPGLTVEEQPVDRAPEPAAMRKRRRLGVAVAAAAVVIAGAVAAFAFAGRGDGESADTGGPAGATDETTPDGVLDLGDVWVGSVAAEGGVARIDREAGEVSADVALANLAEDPVVTDDYVWVGTISSSDGAVVQQIDRNDASVIREISLDVRDPAGMNLEVLLAPSGVWALAVPTDARPVVVRIGEDGQVLARAELEDATANVEPVAQGEQLYVAQPTGVARVEANGTVTTGVVPGTPRRGGLAVEDETLYVVRNDMITWLSNESMQVVGVAFYWETADRARVPLIDPDLEASVDLEEIYVADEMLTFLVSGPERDGTDFVRVSGDSGFLTRTRLPGQQAAGFFDLRRTDPDTFWGYLSEDEDEPALLRMSGDGSIEEIPVPARGSEDPDLVLNGGRVVVSDVDPGGTPVAHLVNPSDSEIEFTVELTS